MSTAPQSFSILASFLAGVATFVSPCVLPLIPAYITFITGTSLEELKNSRQSRFGVFFHALAFVMGFSLVFVALGASASYFGAAIRDYSSIIRWVGGIVIIVFGFHVAGIVRIPLLYHEQRMGMTKLNLGYLGSFLIGVAFAIGWTPCVGPILSSILILASTQETVSTGIILLSAYSIGLGLPFLITALFINTALKTFNRLQQYFKVIEIGAGVLLIVLGVLIITDSFSVLTRWANMLFM